MQNQTPKNILLTGTSTGFGNLTARRLLEDGHNVFATMRDSKGRNQNKAAELQAVASNNKGTVTILDLDVTDSSSIEVAVAQATTAAGHIDVLINNAGQAYLGPFEAFSDEQLREQFEVNFFGPATLVRTVLPNMRAGSGGLILNISSGLGRVTFPGTGVYSASKFAIEAMSESVRYEAAQFGVDSVTVEPGAFDTEIAGRFVAPTNTESATAYGHLGETVANWQGNLGEYFGAGGGDPREVVEAIVKLIDTEPGQRPIRVAVGQDVGFVQEQNQNSLATQRAGLAAFGMADFEQLVR